MLLSSYFYSPFYLNKWVFNYIYFTVYGKNSKNDVLHNGLINPV